MTLMNNDIICFCHLRWNFVYQRPQHLLTRFSRNSRVFIVEEPRYWDTENHLEIKDVDNQQIWVATPHLRKGLNEQEAISAQKGLVDELIDTFCIENFIA